MLANWQHLLSGPRYPIEPSWIGETPLIASKVLLERVEAKLALLLAGLQPYLAKRNDPSWPNAPAADVLSADVAIVEAPEDALGWDLRWVEFQTFTSLVSMIYTLHRAATDVWPDLTGLAFWGALPDGADWRQSTREWMAPLEGSILLENNPWSQPTRHDFEAARHWFDVTIVTPEQLRAQDGMLGYESTSGKWQRVPHIANRLILHETNTRETFQTLLSSLPMQWNSHPVWYYRVNKGLMPYLSLTPNDRSARGDRWRSLGLPADMLVAKHIHSYAGRGIRLHLDDADLATLESPEEWVVQPRFKPMSLLNARDGAPLYGEIRCVVALPAGRVPWTVCRLARMTRGPLASAASWSGLPGEGAVPVYAPPD